MSELGKYEKRKNSAVKMGVNLGCTYQINLFDRISVTTV